MAGTSTTRPRRQPGSTRRTWGTAVRASAAIRSASAAPPWTRTSVRANGAPGAGRTATAATAGLRRRSRRCRRCPSRWAKRTRTSMRSAPPVEAGEPPRGLRRTPPTRRRGPLPRPRRRSAARSPRRGAPARCGPPRPGPSAAAGGGAQPPAPTRGSSRPYGGLQAAQERRRLGRGRLRGCRAAQRRVVRRVALGQPDDQRRRRGPGTAKGRPPTNGGDRPPARSGPARGRRVSQGGPRRRTASCRAEPPGCRPRGSRRSRSCRCRCTCRRG